MFNPVEILYVKKQKIVVTYKDSQSTLNCTECSTFTPDWAVTAFFINALIPITQSLLYYINNVSYKRRKKA